MRAQFIDYIWENPSHTIATVRLIADKPYYFTPGQYADIVIPHDKPDARGTTRTMTFSSLPSDKYITFTTRFSQKAGSTYKRTLQGLDVHSPVTLTDPMGDMVLPLDSAIPLVFVAGGLGIASYVSMVRWLIDKSDWRDITLLYAVRDTGDIIFQDEFDGYEDGVKLKKVLYTTDNKAGSLHWNGDIEQARLTSKDIVRFVKPNSQIYISGAEKMVEQLRIELEKEHGIPQYRIAHDYFDGYSEL